MRELPTFELARILIRTATGEQFGDGEIVTDLVIGYAEPGYGSDDAVIVFGNWNPKRFPRGDDAPLTKPESLAPRLGDALSKIGAEIEWLDEWARCENCYRALRTQGDSYSWKMYGAWFNDCEIVCADCILSDLDSYISEYVNDPARAITFASGHDLEAIGFEQFAPNDPRQYESGWFEGQNDNPIAILRDIARELDGYDVSEVPESTPIISSAREVVFLIDSVGQFDMRFSAYYRLPESDDDEEQESADDDDDHTCVIHGLEFCNAPECIGALLSEVRDAERYANESED